MHQPGGVPDAGGEEAEQGRRWVPRQHPVAEELLAAGLTTILPSCGCYYSTIMFCVTIECLLSFRVTKCITKKKLLPLSLDLYSVACRVCVRGSSCLLPVVKPNSPPNLTTLSYKPVSSVPASLQRSCNLYWTIM